MARRDLGGGVLRTVSHELDLVGHWLGTLESVTGLAAKVSELEIDVDDVAVVVARAGGATAVIELDYLAPKYRREGSLFGTHGRVDYDFGAGTVRFTPYQGAPTDVVGPLDPASAVEAMYEGQARDLLGLVRGEPSRACSWSEAVRLVRAVEAVEATVPTPLA
jgi:predicted dehydrogenase